MEDSAGSGEGGGSFAYTTDNVLFLAVGGRGDASSGYNGVDGQRESNGTSSEGKDSSHVRNEGTDRQPGGVGAGCFGQGCDRLGSSHAERGGSIAQGWIGGQA